MEAAGSVVWDTRKRMASHRVSSVSRAHPRLTLLIRVALPELSRSPRATRQSTGWRYESHFFEHGRLARENGESNRDDFLRITRAERAGSVLGGLLGSGDEELATSLAPQVELTSLGRAASRQ